MSPRGERWWSTTIKMIKLLNKNTRKLIFTIEEYNISGEILLIDDEPEMEEGLLLNSLNHMIYLLLSFPFIMCINLKV